MTATDPSDGSVSIINGLIEYTPNQDFNGSDSFSSELSENWSKNDFNLGLDLLFGRVRNHL